MTPETVNQKRWLKQEIIFLMMHTYLEYFNLKTKNTHKNFLKYSVIATERKPIHFFLFIYLFSKERTKERKVV